MLTRIIVKVLGGFWIIRLKYNDTKFHFLKRMYSFLYTYSLQSKGSWISLNTKFLSEPCFPHGIYGVFISGETVIGRNCVIFQHVTIGSNTLIDSKGLGVPTIGDNCYIGAGAKIIGNVRVGKNVRIGSNTVVYQDVPDNSVVTSSNQRVKQKEQPLKNIFYHKYNQEWVFYNNGVRCKVQDPDELSLLNRFFQN